MTVHHNDSEIFIDDPEYFLQYLSWLLSEHEGNTLKPTNNQFSTAQLGGGSKSHCFMYITIFTYIRTIKCKVQIINDSKSPANVFGLVILKKYKNKHYYTTLVIVLYATRPKKHNNSNCTQTLQSIQKCNNWGSQMFTNHHRYKHETQSWNNSQINK